MLRDRFHRVPRSSKGIDLSFRDLMEIPSCRYVLAPFWRMQICTPYQKYVLSCAAVSGHGSSMPVVYPRSSDRNLDFGVENCQLRVVTDRTLRMAPMRCTGPREFAQYRTFNFIGVPLPTGDSTHIGGIHAQRFCYASVKSFLKLIRLE